jgi:hypothetical protein
MLNNLVSHWVFMLHGFVDTLTGIAILQSSWRFDEISAPVGQGQDIVRVRIEGLPNRKKTVDVAVTNSPC